MGRLDVFLYDSGAKRTFEEVGFYSFTGTREPTEIRFIPVGSELYNQNKGIVSVTVYVDEFINFRYVDRSLTQFHVGWFRESRAITPWVYRNAKRQYEYFDLLVTHDKKLLEIDNKFEYAACGGTWLTDEEIFLAESSKFIDSKNSGVSIIASSKRSAVGHKLRHKVISSLARMNKFDVYGHGYKPINSKHQALSSYQFSIVILNCAEPYYFTEALIDVLLSKTIPIFWGDSTIIREFDPNGVLFWNNLNDLKDILQIATPELYLSKLESINVNYTRALELMSTDNNFRKAIARRLNI